MKTFVAVMTCARYLDRRNAVRDTWMPWVQKLKPGVDVKFFSGMVSNLYVVDHLWLINFVY